MKENFQRSPKGLHKRDLLKSYITLGIATKREGSKKDEGEPLIV